MEPANGGWNGIAPTTGRCVSSRSMLPSPGNHHDHHEKNYDESGYPKHLRPERCAVHRLSVRAAAKPRVGFGRKLVSHVFSNAELCRRAKRFQASILRQ
jgi:hypothetical protein